MNAVIKTLDERILKTLSPLNCLSSAQLEKLISSSGIERFGAGSAIYKDKKGSILYLLSGSIVFTRDNEVMLAIKAGTTEASLPLNHYWDPGCAVHAKTKLILLSIEKSIFDQLFIADVVNDQINYQLCDFEANTINSFATGSVSFPELPPANFQSLLSHIEEITVIAGDTVIHQGSPGDNYYIVKKGRFAVVQDKPGLGMAEIASLLPGAGFGEEALITNGTRTASVIAREDGTLIKITKQDFTSYMLAPALRSIPEEETNALIAQGAIVINVDDVLPKKNLTVHQHIPLIEFRNQLTKLSKQTKYITFCNSGHKSAVAAFLLSQYGFTAFVLINHDRFVSTSTSRAELMANNSEKLVNTQALGAEVIDFPKTRTKFQEPTVNTNVLPQVNTANHELPLLLDIISTGTPEKAIHKKVTEWAAKQQALETARAKEAAALKAAEAEAERLKKEADAISQLAAEKISQAAELKVAKKIAEAEHRTQSQIAAIKRRADEEARKAKSAEQAWRRAEEEISRLKSEIANSIAGREKVVAQQENSALDDDLLFNSIVAEQEQRPAAQPQQGTPKTTEDEIKLGWISDAYLWETVIGYRKDPAVEALLENPGKNSFSHPKVKLANPASEVEADSAISLNLEPKKFDHKALFLRANNSEISTSTANSSASVKAVLAKKSPSIQNSSWRNEVLIVIVIALAVVMLAGPNKLYRWLNEQYNAISTHQVGAAVSNWFSDQSSSPSEQATVLTPAKQKAEKKHNSSKEKN